MLSCTYFYSKNWEGKRSGVLVMWFIKMIKLATINNDLINLLKMYELKNFEWSIKRLMRLNEQKILKIAVKNVKNVKKGSRILGPTWMFWSRGSHVPLRELPSNLVAPGTRTLGSKLGFKVMGLTFLACF